MKLENGSNIEAATKVGEAIAEKAKDAAGCLLPFAILILTAPVLLISGLFSIGKKSKIEQSIYDMEREYSQHTGNFEFFKASHKKAEKLLDKYGKNNNYSEFVKEAMNFLHSGQWQI